MLFCIYIPSLCISHHVYAIPFVDRSLYILYCMYILLCAYPQYVYGFIYLFLPYVCPFNALVFIMHIFPSMYSFHMYISSIHKYPYIFFLYACPSNTHVSSYVSSIHISPHIYAVYVSMALCVTCFVFILLCIYTASCLWVYCLMCIRPDVYVVFTHMSYVYIFYIYTILFICCFVNHSVYMLLYI